MTTTLPIEHVTTGAEQSAIGGLLADCERCWPACANLTDQHFADRNYAAVFSVIADLVQRRGAASVNMMIVMDELTRRSIDVNVATLTACVDAYTIPAGMAGWVAELVGEHERRRLALELQDAHAAVISAKPEDVPDVLDGLKTKLDAVATTGSDQFETYRLSDLEAYTVRPEDHIAGRGWLRRCGGTLLTAGTGDGKSVLAMQIGVSVASGLNILGGIRVERPGRVLIIEAENDGEVLQRDTLSIVKHLRADRELVQQNLVTRFVYALTGAAFGRFVQHEVRHHRPDLLVIDPYQSFVAAADLNSSQTFLEWIKPIETAIRIGKCALLLVVHTPKPRDRSDWHVREGVYMAAGHSVQANWARASCELMALGSEGDKFKLRFSKNGERTGLVDEAGHLVRDLYIEHSGNPETPYWKVSEDQNPAPAVSSKFAEKIIQLATEHPSMGYREIAKRVGCSVGTVSQWYPSA